MRKHLLLVSIIMVLASLMSACSAIDDMVYVTVGPDEVVCVYGRGGREGQGLIETMLPGTEPMRFKDGSNVVRIPLSVRFWNMVLDDQIRDPGASPFFEQIADNGTPVNTQGIIKFVFNAAAACGWYDLHGGRNAGRTYEGDRVIFGDLGFNARPNQGEVPDPNASSASLRPWFQYLAENFDPKFGEVSGIVVQQHEWDYAYYNLPVGADEDGSLPANASEEDNVPTIEAMKEETGHLFTQRLNASLGVTEDGLNFFCGPTKNQADPNDCPPIQVDTLIVRPQAEELVTNRQEVRNRQEALENQRQLDLIAVEQVQLDNDRRDREEAAAIADAESAANREAAEIQARLDANLAELQQQQALAEAQLQVAPCQAQQVSGQDCALLLYILNGGELPDFFGSGIEPTVQVPASDS